MAGTGSVMVGRIPRGVRRADLHHHFTSASVGGGVIEYILHPLGNDLSMAVIKFEEPSVANSVLYHEHVIQGAIVQAVLLPRQVLGHCQADIDPLIVAGLPDLAACMDLLRTDFGIDVKYDPVLRTMSMSGSFLQIQFAQAALNSIYRQQEERREQALTAAADKALGLPLRAGEVATPPAAPMPSRETLSPLSFKSDHFSELESPPRTLKLEDLQGSLSGTLKQLSSSHQLHSPTGSIRSGGTETQRSLEEVLAEHLSESLRSPRGSRASSVDTRHLPETSSLPPDELSPFQKADRVVEDMFSSSCSAAIRSRPRPSEPLTADDLRSTGGMLSTWGAQSGQRVVLEFDSQIFDYMRRTHGKRLKDLENSYQVQMLYKKRGDLTQVRIMPVGSDDDSPMSPAQAKTSLMNFYQMVLQAVTKQGIALQGLAPKNRPHLEKVLTKVRDDFKDTVYVDARDRTRLTLVGESQFVDRAEELIRGAVDLKRETESTVKPKMIFMMQASKPDASPRGQATERHSGTVDIKKNPTPTKESPRAPSSRSSSRRGSTQSVEGRPKSAQAERRLSDSLNSSVKRPHSAAARTEFERVASPTGPLDESRTSQHDRSLRASVKSPLQSPRAASWKGDSPRESLRDSQNITVGSPRGALSPRSSTQKSLVESQTLEGEVRSSAPKTAWPTPEPAMGSPRSGEPKPVNSSQLSVQTSVTQVTPLSSHNLSSQDLTGLSYASTTLDVGHSGEVGLSYASTHDSLVPEAEKHLSRVSFMSSGDLEGTVSNGLKQSKVYKFVTKEHMKVSVYRGEIVEAGLDVIVCPAREDLRLLHGVASDISVSAEDRLQQLCTAHVVKYGPLETSKVIALPASGNLRCQYIVCAAGPMWCLYPDKAECEMLLKQTILNSLIEASNLRATSVGMPAVGTGELGIPADVCAWAMLAAIEEFSSTDSFHCIKEIHIINKDSHATSVIGETLEEVLTERDSGIITPKSSPRDMTEMQQAKDDVPFICRLTAACVKISERAGAIIRDVLAQGDLGIVEKGINDLQTEADRSAERCIVASLKAQFPGIITVGEESGKVENMEVNPNWVEMGQSEEVLAMCQSMSEAHTAITLKDVVVWIDPLDGTSEYTEGLLDHVTTLIGIGVRGKAVGGVIHQPFYNYQEATDIPRGRSIWGIIGVGAFGYTRKAAPEGQNIIVTTRSHGTGAVAEAVSACEPTEVIRVGGCGHKVLLVLQGEAHAYVFASPGCKKWDTAAPEAILHAAGGRLTDIHGNSLEYTENVQHRNAAGVMATPPGGYHEKYLRMIPQGVRDSLPVIYSPKGIGHMHEIIKEKPSPRDIQGTEKNPFITQLMAACVKISERAGAIIRDVLAQGDLGIVEKGINDLQTEADRSAERCIVASLKAQFPGIITVGEESGKVENMEVNPNWVEMGQSEEVLAMCQSMSEAHTAITLKDVVVWIDPLDGTSEYTEGLLDHVTTLIGIGVRGKAVGGVIHQPFYNYQEATDIPRGRSIWGIIGVGAFGYTHKAAPEGQNIIVTTRSHGTGAVAEAVSACEPTEVIRVGGCGHKVLLVLQGEAHAYVFASPGCKKWDTAAPEAILHAAGGRLTDIHGNSLEYTENVQHRNAAGVLATPPGGYHEKYLRMIPQGVRDSLPVVYSSKVSSPMHEISSAPITQANGMHSGDGPPPGDPDDLIRASVELSLDSIDTTSQPIDGQMLCEVDRKTQLPGHPDTTTLIITYVFSSGDQKGKQYQAETFVAYLPNNQRGRHILKLLQKAFQLGLTFRVQESADDADSAEIRWAEIPHKTKVDGGPENNGYPDDDYLDNVEAFLKSLDIHVEEPQGFDN